MRNTLVTATITVTITAGLVPTGTATASADEPVTITLSAEQVQFLCEKRLPKIEKRVDRLLTRINGDAEVRGSAEWLLARATGEREAGRETSAQLLAERADRRLDRVDDLTRIKQWAAGFRTGHCGSR